MGTPSLLCSAQSRGGLTPRKELKLQPVCVLLRRTRRKQTDKRRSGKCQRQRISALSGRAMPPPGRSEVFGWSAAWRHQDSAPHKALGEGHCWQQCVSIGIETCADSQPRGKAACGLGALGSTANVELFQSQLPGRIPAGKAGLLPKRAEMSLGWEAPARSLALPPPERVQLS